MKSRHKSQPQSTTGPSAVEIFQIENVSDYTRSMSEAIERRAYEVYAARGRQPGHALDDWLCAESELAPQDSVDLSDLGDRVTVRVELPQASAQHVKLGVEACRLAIIRTAEPAAGPASGERAAGAPTQICRVVDLPVEVDPRRASAILESGLLKITLPKTGRS